MDRRTQFFGFVAAAACSFATPPALEAAADDGYTIFRLGFADAEHEYAVSGGTSSFSFVNGLSPSGTAAGVSSRYTASGIDLGVDGWFFNGTGTVLVGLSGNNYQYETTGPGGGTYRIGEAQYVDGSGHRVSGYSSRYGVSGEALGADAWLFDGVATHVVGLTGAGYEYTTAAGTVRSATSYGMSPAGHVLGQAARYSSSGASLGADVWLSDGTNTSTIGLTGSGYEYTTAAGTFRFGRVPQVSPPNAAGNVLGIAQRYDAAGTNVGQDAWLFDGTSTRLAGLTGPGYEYASAGGTYRFGDPISLTSAGRAIGITKRYTTTGAVLGQDAWLFDGAATKQIGLTGVGYEYTKNGGTMRSSSPMAAIASSPVRGYSLRYSSTGGNLGEDAWVADSAGTRLLALTGADYGYAAAGGTFRRSSTGGMDAAGNVIGQSSRYDASGNSLGVDGWLFNGTTVRQVGLSGSGYEYTTGGRTFRSGSPSGLNAAGQMTGYASRFTAGGTNLGQAGWFYEPSTGATTPLLFSVRASDNFGTTTPELLTEAGAVLGSYELFAGDTDVGTRAFLWTGTDGMHDLGALVKGGLTARGWSSLADVYGAGQPGAQSDGSPNYIAGYGQVTGQVGGQSAFLMSSVPEPVMTMPVVTLGLLLLRRRRPACRGGS
jgi:hypothetical protein